MKLSCPASWGKRWGLHSKEASWYLQLWNLPWKAILWFCLVLKKKKCSEVNWSPKSSPVWGSEKRQGACFIGDLVFSHVYLLQPRASKSFLSSLLNPFLSFPLRVVFSTWFQGCSVCCTNLDFLHLISVSYFTISCYLDSLFKSLCPNT